MTCGRDSLVPRSDHSHPQACQASRSTTRALPSTTHPRMFSAHQYRPLPAPHRTHQATPHHTLNPTRTPPHVPQPAHAQQRPGHGPNTRHPPSTRNAHQYRPPRVRRPHSSRHKPVLPPPKRSSINPSPPPNPREQHATRARGTPILAHATPFPSTRHLTT